MDYKGYRARVVYDNDAEVLHGEVEGLLDVITFTATNVAALRSAFHTSVDDYLVMCAQRGEAPERPYSGKLLVRMEPYLHRLLSATAAEREQSLNAVIVDMLALQANAFAAAPKGKP